MAAKSSFDSRHDSKIESAKGASLLFFCFAIVLAIVCCAFYNTGQLLPLLFSAILFLFSLLLSYEYSQLKRPGHKLLIAGVLLLAFSAVSNDGIWVRLFHELQPYIQNKFPNNIDIYSSFVNVVVPKSVNIVTHTISKILTFLSGCWLVHYGAKIILADFRNELIIETDDFNNIETDR